MYNLSVHFVAYCRSDGWGEKVQHRRPLLYQIWREHDYTKPDFQTNISEI